MLKTQPIWREIWAFRIHKQKSHINLAAQNEKKEVKPQKQKYNTNNAHQ